MNVIKTALAYTLGSLRQHVATISWNPEPEASSFYVFRSHNGISNWTLEGTTSLLTFQDTDVRGGLTYFYEVKAMGPTGLKSAPSLAISVTVPLL